MLASLPRPAFCFLCCRCGARDLAVAWVAVLRERVVGVAIFLTCGAGVVRVFLFCPVFVSLFVVGVCLLWLVFMLACEVKRRGVWCGVVRSLAGAG